MSKRLTQEEVEKIFSDGGCIFDDIYINTYTPHIYTCKCGNKSKISIDNFKSGKRCKKCSGKEKHTFDYVYNYFKEQGCELLEPEYINSYTKMNYICNCGNKSDIRFSDFKNGSRCYECGIKIIKEKRKNSYRYIYNSFKDNGCKLLETEYINSQTKMKYICNCGTFSYITWSNFQRGKRCRKCGSEKISNSKIGENHPSWIKNRKKLSSIKRIRRGFSRSWSLKHMTHDPNYDKFKLNPKNYNTDHIIPIYIFRDLIFEYHLDETQVRKIINQKENLQLLNIDEHNKKYKNGCTNEAKEYLIKHGIQLI